jgi:hypothetical protein
LFDFSAFLIINSSILPLSYFLPDAWQSESTKDWQIKDYDLYLSSSSIYSSKMENGVSFVYLQLHLLSVPSW